MGRCRAPTGQGSQSSPPAGVPRTRSPRLGRFASDRPARLADSAHSCRHPERIGRRDGNRASFVRWEIRRTAPGRGQLAPARPLKGVRPLPAALPGPVSSIGSHGRSGHSARPSPARGGRIPAPEAAVQWHLRRAVAWGLKCRIGAGMDSLDLPGLRDPTRIRPH